MDESPVTPSVESQEPLASAPPPEQARTAQAAESPTTDAGLMRAYTQGQQKLAAVASALGISKTSTVEQFSAAINARRQTLAQADMELEQDPRLAEQAAKLRAREEHLARAQYGASADLAVTLMEAARSGAGALELTEIVDGYVIEAAASRFAGVPQGQPQQQAQPPQGQQARAPERDLMMEAPRGNSGMFDPGIAPDRDKGPAGFFTDLMAKLSAR